jgi:hypothetical protein
MVGVILNGSAGGAAAGAALFADAAGALGVLRADGLAQGLDRRFDGHGDLLTSTDVYVDRQMGSAHVS